MDIVVAIVKYTGWAATVGTAFVGTWFFEFTTTDKDTGRRRLNKWGRRAIVFAGLALCLALVTTVLTDMKAAEDKAAAANRIAAEKAAAEAEQATAKAAQQRMLDMLTVVAKAVDKLTPEQLQQVDAISANTPELESLRRKYPDLYDRFKEQAGVAAQVLLRDMEQHLSIAPECAEIAFEDGGAAANAFRIVRVPVAEGTNLSFRVMPDGVAFSLFLPMGSADAKDGYGIEFVDGNTEVIKCDEFGAATLCTANTNRGASVEIFRQLQSKLVNRLTIGDQFIAISATAAETLRKTAGCIIP